MSDKISIDPTRTALLVMDFQIMTVNGYAVAGRTRILTIHGTGFYGQPRITSHLGTTAVVIRDTGQALVVRVAVRPRSRNGVFTFTIVLGDGEACQIRYNQR